MKPSRRFDSLIALLAILASGVVLIALGVDPDALGTISIALAGLYAAWASSGGKNASNDDDKRDA
ncbi:hypothetical protein OHA18_25905 [Kribbella sp. NBC_00709]|uniref:hypothetical protein n=1 Tax=Kribbella sp. NBC_00709 TaxID=2975972 RepID=UPI002E2CFA48|nr:hypothetical protein [Kribbella sp. NBC_00709]